MILSYLAVHLVLQAFTWYFSENRKKLGIHFYDNVLQNGKSLYIIKVLSRYINE